MPLLTAYNCSLVLSRPMLLVDGETLTYTDRHGRLLINSVKVTREVVIHSQELLSLGLISGQPHHLLLATNVNRPQRNGKMITTCRCMNPTEHSVILKCQEPQEGRMLAELLTRHGNVFSTGDEDMGKTTLVEHRISLVDDAWPVPQHAHRLGPGEEAEVEREFAHLLKTY